MSWTVVARKDFRDAGRSKMLWAVTVLFVLLIAGLAYVFQLIQGTGSGASGEVTVDAIGLISFLLSPIVLFVPLIGLIVGHKAIVGEVESGSAKLLLSLPHDRRDVVLGKAIGRGVVLGVSLLVGVAVAAVIVLVFYDQFSFTDIGLFTLFTLLFGLVYVSIGVAISAATQSGSRATAYAVGFFALFELLWGAVQAGLYYLVEGSFQPPLVQEFGRVYFDAPGWYFFVQRLSPSASFQATVTGFVQDGTFTFVPAFDGGLPFYLTEWAALAMLVLWGTVPLLFGYLRFRDADL